MLDTNLINKSILHTQKVISTHVCTHGLVLLQDVLHNDLAEQLLDFANNNTKWEDVEYNSYIVKHRKKISWATDGIIEVAHTVFESVTPEISTLLNKELIFMGVNLWKDTEGYSIGKHTDNPVLKATAQIYLQNSPGLGTIFECNGKEITVNHNANAGYLADNTLEIPHWLNEEVPKDFERFSLHVVWG